MNQIHGLNSMVASLIPRDSAELPQINREGIELWPEAPPDVREAAERVKAALDELIPADFEFSILLGDQKPNCSVRYSDGAKTGFGVPLDLVEDQSLEASLGSEDWNRRRAEALQEMHFVEQILKISKSFPVRLPSTKELQRCYRDHLKTWIKEVRCDLSNVFVLIWSQDNALIQLTFDSMSEFEDELPDIMVHQDYVVAVVAGGKPLPVDRIEGIKTKTLRLMEVRMPMSYAKATGQFAQAMQAIEAVAADSNADEDL